MDNRNSSLLTPHSSLIYRSMKMDRKMVRIAAVTGAAILLAAAVMVYFFVYAGSPQPEIGEIITPVPTAEEIASPEPTLTAEPTVAPSEKPEQTPTTEPEKLTEAPAETEPSEAPECDYVLNKKSMKIHYPWCSGVAQMKESNKIYFTGTIDEARAQGYESCGTCKP